MRKRNKTLLMIIFLSFFVLFFYKTGVVFAETNPPKPLILKFQVPIPGGPTEINFSTPGNHLGGYVRVVYNYAISIVGIVATIMLMFGGFIWLTAGGSGDKVGQARDIIFGSLAGLVLALTSYTILNMINPDLVNFKAAVVTPASNEFKKEEKKTTSEECREKCLPYGYQYNPTTGTCDCSGSGTHRVCKIEPGVTADTNYIECVTVDFPGVDECDGTSNSCKTQINCCGCAQGKLFAGCSSSFRMTVKDCDSICSWYQGKGTLINNHTCENKKCIPI